MPFGGLLTAGLIGAGGSIFSGLFGASAAKKAAQQQVAQQEKALAFQQQEYADQKANQAPFLQAGQYSIGQLMSGLKNGTFGPDSIPAFKAPTLAEAQATPGYEFTRQQGEQGIERGAAAAGGAFTGGTLKALASFNSGLADSTYNDVFTRAMQAYNAQLTGQNQAFGQLASTAGIGEGAAVNLGAAGAQAAQTVGNTLTNIGSAQAAGTIGSASALTGAINGATNAATAPFYLNYLHQSQTSPQLSSTNLNPYGPGFSPTTYGDSSVALSNPFAGGG